MKAESVKQIQFARCPRCNAVIKFDSGVKHTSCIKCGVKINLK